MTQVLIKGELSDTLSGLTDRCKLLNEDGEFLGLFLPAGFRGLPVFEDISEEEITRRSQLPGSTTLAHWEPSTEFCGSVGKSFPR